MARKAYGKGTTDKYMLQRLVNGSWSNILAVSKSGATHQCRNFTKRLGVSHRVINLSKNNEILVECKP